MKTLKAVIFKNYKTTIIGLVTAFFSFVVFSPDYFEPWFVNFAKFLLSGGVAGLGIAAKDHNVTGGTQEQ